ncbi:MAG: hypothetical protein LBE25_08250 [Arthrobacter sp.]|nr:hypothetical protein [Arthrobacter sp.]
MSETPDPVALRTAMAPLADAFAAAARASTTFADAETGAGKPEFSDEVIRENTGHDWAEWVGLIDAGPGRQAGHTAIAAWVHENFEVNGWWAQGVTVSYERLVGLRLPGQMADGTFTVQKNKTLEGNREALRAWWVSDDARAALLPGLASVLRSKPEAKQLKVALSGAAGEALGTVGLSVEEAKGRLKINVSHEKLPSSAAGEEWRNAWGAWLDALAGALAS